MIKITLITILSIQVLILSLLLFLRKENKLTNSLLGFILFLFGLATINFSLFQGLLQEQLLEYIPYLRLELLYALGPAIYAYTLAATSSGFKLRRVHLLIFLPALLELIYYRTSFYREGAGIIGFEPQNFLQLLFIVQQWIGVIYSTTFMLVAVYVFFKYQNYRGHTKYV
ncbi:MAG: hypothetical protein AAGG68_15555 [Bacteroidota bacterium]